MHFLPKLIFVGVCHSRAVYFRHPFMPIRKVLIHKQFTKKTTFTTFDEVENSSRKKVLYNMVQGVVYLVTQWSHKDNHLYVTIV